MLSLCRLCAQCPVPSELTTEIVELEPKLALCCGWQPSNIEFQMPKKACNSCVDELQRSWNLVEQIREAETQLNKLLSEQIQDSSNRNDSRQTVEFKSERNVEQTNYIFDTKFDADDDYFNDGGGGGDGDDDYYDNDSNIDEHGAVFGESINYVKDEETKPEKSPRKTEKEPAAKRKPNKNHFKNDPFLATLNPEDFLDNGQISSTAVEKLTKLNPDMSTMSWNDCQYNCTKCKQILKGASNMYAHMRSMHIDDPKMSVKLSCFYCNFKHRREATINTHIATEHFEHLKFRCMYCADYYWNKMELTHHRNLHTDVAYKCERCDLTFFNRDTMYSHCSLQHSKKYQNREPEEYICDLCAKRFKTKAGVRSHLFLHMKRYDHVCEICGWKFASKGNLKGHLASTHATERPFKCSQCYKRFKTKHQMQNHAVIHNNVYKHECSVCGRKFRRPYTLGVHMRSHTLDTPYTCRYCGKSFRHNITLQTHERTHTNDKPYKCTHCEYCTTSKGNLNKHMMRAHSIDNRNHIVNQENQEN